MSKEQEAYHDKVNTYFAENMFKKMAAKRYGLEFCCDRGKSQIIFRQDMIKKELLNFNNISDPISKDGGADGGIIPNAGSSACASIKVSSGRGGGVVTYTPYGAWLPVEEVWPENSSKVVILNYDLDAGFTLSDLPGEGAQDLVVETLTTGCLTTCTSQSFLIPVDGGSVAFIPCDGLEPIYTYFDNDTAPGLVNGVYGPVCAKDGTVATFINEPLGDDIIVTNLGICQ